MSKYNINLSKYYEEYKDVVKACYNKGKILPALLSEIPIPLEYRFHGDDFEKFFNNLSKKCKESIRREYIERRKVSTDYISRYAFTKTDANNESLKKWDKFKDKEFEVFLEDFPIFESLLE